MTELFTVTVNIYQSGFVFVFKNIFSLFKLIYILIFLNYFDMIILKNIIVINSHVKFTKK